MVERYEESLDIIFKPFQLSQITLVKLNNGTIKDPFNKEEESPIKNIGLDENFFEILALNQCDPSNTCNKVLEELEICLTK